MTIKLKGGAEFLHVPKTGGCWVESVLEKNGLIEKRIGHRHADYDFNLMKSTTTGREHVGEAARYLMRSFLKRLGYPPEPAGDTAFRFCFVRHPLAWYESWWKFMQGLGWNEWGLCNSRSGWHPNAILNGLGSNNFNDFVRKVVQTRPGYVSSLYFGYTKPGITFIGKTERIRQDLARILEMLDLPFDRSTVEHSPKENVSQGDAEQIRWDPQLKATVMRLELPALVHFGYLNERERSELGVEMPVRVHPAVGRAPKPRSVELKPQGVAVPISAVA